MVISRDLLDSAVQKDRQKEAEKGRDSTGPPSSATTSPQMAFYFVLGAWLLLPVASHGAGMKEMEGYFVVEQVSDVYFPYRVPAAPLCLRLLLPPNGCLQTLTLCVSVVFVSCLLRVWPGHSLRIANSRVLYYPLVGTKLWQPFVKSLDLPIGLSVGVFALLLPIGILPAVCRKKQYVHLSHTWSSLKVFLKLLPSHKGRCPQDPLASFH